MSQYGIAVGIFHGQANGRMSNFINKFSIYLLKQKKNHPTTSDKNDFSYQETLVPYRIKFQYSTGWFWCRNTCGKTTNWESEVIYPTATDFYTPIIRWVILCETAVRLSVCPSVCPKTLRFRAITQKVLQLHTWYVPSPYAPEETY